VRSPLNPRLRRYLGAVFVLQLALSSDAFLLLRASDLGVPGFAIPLLWSFHHVVKVLSSTPGGALSDRIGRRATLVIGYAIYVAVYAMFAFAGAAWHAWAIMALYGLFFGLVEGTEKALVSDLTTPAEAGSAFGAFHLTVGLAALPASLFFGLLWRWGGAQLAFLTGAGIAAVGVVLLQVSLRQTALRR
jgi:MFS family permease